MIRIFFRKKDIVSITFLAVICAVIITFLQVGIDAPVNLEGAFLTARDGFIVLGEREYHSDAFTCTFNMVLAIVFISKLFSEDIDIAKSFVFIRIKKKGIWFKYKFLQTLVYSFYYSFIYHLSILASVYLLGYKTDKYFVLAKYVIWGMITSFMIIFMILVVCNILGLYMKPHLATALITALTVLSIGVVCFLHLDQVQYHLLISYFISWHTIASSNSAVYSFPTWSYYAVIAVIILVELILAKIFVKKKDFI